MLHTLSYCALIGKCALIRSNTVGLLTLFKRLRFIAELANSVDPDEAAHYEPPHLDLHCLPSDNL